MTTFLPNPYPINPNGGAFVYVGAPGAGKVVFSLRVQDLSREALTWGTTIPLIREAQTYTSTLQLLDVPTDSRFRVALRVYDFDLPSDRAVRLRIYDESPIPGVLQTALVDTILQLKVPIEDRNDSIPGSNAMTDLIGTFPQLASAQLLRIVLDPVSSDLRFWAFVSVTNNETQHVTAITPN